MCVRCVLCECESSDTRDKNLHMKNLKYAAGQQSELLTFIWEWNRMVWGEMRRCEGMSVLCGYVRILTSLLQTFILAQSSQHQTDLTHYSEFVWHHLVSLLFTWQQKSARNYILAFFHSFYHMRNRFLVQNYQMSTFMFEMISDEFVDTFSNLFALFFNQ